MLPSKITAFIEEDVLARFLRYVQIHTTSDPASTSNPSTACQLDLIHLLQQELVQLGVKNEIDAFGFLYATISASGAGKLEAPRAKPLGFLAHVDTSPDQCGYNVKPQLLQKWDGSTIHFPDDELLSLSSADSPKLSHFIGDTIITASGTTLLGADDKSGVAEIMTALAAFKKFPELVHPEINVCFTHDEEIGRGTRGLDLTKLPKFCYTMDGGFPDELEDECFNAWHAVITILGKGVHPGYAKDRMINASRLAGEIIQKLPLTESPERTEGREGFYHLSSVHGDHERAVIELIIRDFEEAECQRRIAFLEKIRGETEAKYPGATLSLKTRHQYRNMRDHLSAYPFLVERAQRAIEKTGVPVIRRAIRGGTDGSLLSEAGHPTPNIFAGGLMFHSRLEWVALSSMVKAVETIVHLSEIWVNEN